MPHIVQVINILDDQYELEHIDGTEELSAIDKVENTYFHWTINDAKEGVNPNPSVEEITDLSVKLADALIERLK